MKKRYSIILIVFSILIIGIVAYAMINLNDNDDLNTNTEVNLHQGTGGDDSGEFYGWKEELDISIFRYFNAIYEEGYAFDFDEEGKFTITLRQMNEKHHLDLSEFNNSTIECDLDESKIVVLVENGEILRTADLKCINHAEE